MKHSILIPLLILPFLLGLPVAAADPAETPPNVLLILADDLGWGDVSCNQPEKGKVRTPAIDELAAEGMRFTNAHAPHAVCTPTRYSVLTGRYCWRTWLRDGVLAGYAKPLIPPGRTTIASALKGRGYRTAAFGKWHIGLGWQPVAGDPGDFQFGSQLHGPTAKGALAMYSRRVDHDAPVQGGPLALGFDAFFGTPSNASRIPVFIRDDRVVNQPKRAASGLMTDPTLNRATVDDLYVAETTRHIERAVEAEQPFFVYLALNAAHGAVKAPPRFVGKSGIGPRGDRCLWVDESVAKIRALLERLEIADNTLVIFTSDNGPRHDRADLARHGHDGSGPYRGFKTDAWDGGTRVPFIVRWPGRVPAGQVNPNLMSLCDILPTVAAIAGAELPKWAAEDGTDQQAQFFDAEAPPDRTRMITQTYVGILAIREGRWKLILDTKGGGGLPTYSPGATVQQLMAPWRVDLSRSGQLYDIEADPYETSDLFEKQPEIVSRLRTSLHRQIAAGRSPAK